MKFKKKYSNHNFKIVNKNLSNLLLWTNYLAKNLQTVTLRLEIKYKLHNTYLNLCS